MYMLLSVDQGNVEEEGRQVLPESKEVGGEGRSRGERWLKQCIHI